jgi:hypothetical protein
MLRKDNTSHFLTDKAKEYLEKENNSIELEENT